MKSLSVFWRVAVVLALASVPVLGQTGCPLPNYLSARAVNLEPSATTHTNVVRQSDGSYTGFEIADASPYRVIRTTPHIERQFAACLPHTFPASPATGAIVENPPGATSQTRVSETLPSGNYLVATVNGSAILFDIFDPQLNLVSETSFAPAPANPAYPNNFETLKLADLNGDGKLDLIALSEATVPFSEYTSLAGTIWTFLGNGDGTFQAGVSLSVFSLYELTNSASFAVGDVNGDKKPDVVLVVGSYQSPGAFFSLLGNGDGTFTLGQNSVGQTSSFPQGPYGSLALADVNGDGKLDLILAGGTYPTGYPWIVAVALGNGDGTFQTASTSPLSSAP